MANIATRFFGLDLKSPIIAASSSMTGNIDQIIKIADAGAGAVVLKSIFEEEIYHQLEEENEKKPLLLADPEYMDYFDYVIKDDALSNYLKLIKEAKAKTNIPVIASINCMSKGEWLSYAKKIEAAGADALELNLFIAPSDENTNSASNEKFYTEIINAVTQAISIPISVKISHYFSNLTQIVKRIADTGIAGITIFNRFYAPDIDIDKLEIIDGKAFSKTEDYAHCLRWTGILSPKTKIDLCATTGIHSAETVIKLILAGASCVQIASVLYTEGIQVIKEMNEQISRWMDSKNFNSIADFKGALTVQKNDNAIAFERVQFMKYFGNMKF